MSMSMTRPSAGRVPMPLRRDHLVEKFGGDERASGLPCPMLSVLVNEGRLKPDADGAVSVDAMKTALKSVGIWQASRAILAHGGASVTGGGPDKMINLLKLQGSTLDHKGSLGPLQDGGFNPGLLAQLKSFSSDGKGLSLEDIAVAEEVRMRQEDGGFGDKAIGYPELAAFIMIFGKTNADGVKTVPLEDLDTIYRDNKFPADFEAGNINLFNLGWTMMKLAVAQNSSSAAARAEKGLRDALGEPARLDSSSMLGLGASCPAGMRPKGGAGVTGDDMMKLHQSMQPAADAQASHAQDGI